MPLRFPRSLSVIALLALLPAARSRALEPSTPLARYARQSWTMENGLPQNTVPVLMQSRSGYLWAGTELGLARFDGASFRIFDHASGAAFPDAEVRCVLDDMHGELWIGTGDGLVRLAGDRAVMMTTRDGLPGNTIRALAQTTDGRVWVLTDAGMARWMGGSGEASGKFQLETPMVELPSGGITSMAASSNGDLWVGTVAGAMVLDDGHWAAGPQEAKGDRRRSPALVAEVGGGVVLISNSAGIFLAHAGGVMWVATSDALPGDGVTFLARLSGGAIAVASKSAVVLLPGTKARTGERQRFDIGKQLPGVRIESIYADREGALWVGTNHGLARMVMNAGKASVETVPPTDPLFGAAVIALFEDREGDLWVGTETAGLHIFRDARFRTVGARDGLSSDNTTAVVEDTRGTLWIGTRDSGLNRIANGKTAMLTTANGLLSNVILALAAAPDGDLWVGTADGLNRIGKGAGKGNVTNITSADGLPDDFIRSVLAAADGSVWIGTRRGLTHLDHGHFTTLTHADGLGSDLVGALAFAGGDLWIGTLDGLTRLHLSGLERGRLKNYTTADGLSSNVITALDVTSDGSLWIGTQNDGLNLWDGGRFFPVHGGATDTLPAAIHAIVHDDRGLLWLASNAGLTRADAGGLKECALTGNCHLRAVRYTTADGLRSRETSSNSHPTAWKRADGELWFTTPRGAIVVDPLPFADVNGPPIVIERFTVDDREMVAEPEDAEPVRIAAGHLRFQFDYAGLSFAAPQKLRYEYMLDGFDHAWTDAGTRRTAYYTNIPPGKYHFVVRSKISDSEFVTGQQAALEFELLPHFYQTIWSWALAVVAAAALILGYFRWRVKRVEREFGAVMGERNRIAREIHDTLAQGYVGISLQLEVLGELLRHGRTDTAAKHLAMTQELVREGLDDARQSIWALRSQDGGEQTLPVRLRRLVEQSEGGGLAAELEVHGAYRPLAAETEKEMLRIAQEAIQNVKKHAAASRLSVRLDYDERMVALTVRDDGKGFDDRRLTTEQVQGHYGLTGMRERAAIIHAELEITSEPGRETKVQLNVPTAEAMRSAPEDSGKV